MKVIIYLGKQETGLLQPSLSAGLGFDVFSREDSGKQGHMAPLCAWRQEKPMKLRNWSDWEGQCCLWCSGFLSHCPMFSGSCRMDRDEQCEPSWPEAGLKPPCSD